MPVAISHSERARSSDEAGMLASHMLEQRIQRELLLHSYREALLEALEIPNYQRNR